MLAWILFGLGSQFNAFCLSMCRIGLLFYVHFWCSSVVWANVQSTYSQVRDEHANHITINTIHILPASSKDSPIELIGVIHLTDTYRHSRPLRSTTLPVCICGLWSRSPLSLFFLQTLLCPAWCMAGMAHSGWQMGAFWDSRSLPDIHPNCTVPSWFGASQLVPKSVQHHPTSDSETRSDGDLSRINLQYLCPWCSHRWIRGILGIDQ